MKRYFKRLLIFLLVFCVAVAVELLIFANLMFNMPGETYVGPVAVLTEDEVGIREYMRDVVHVLAVDLGVRAVNMTGISPEKTDRFSLLRENMQEHLDQAADYIENEFQSIGYQPTRQEYAVHGVPCYNIIVEQTGRTNPEEIFIIGAHYDSVDHTYGANDNASGVAALLALARAFCGNLHENTLRFVAFTNEEPPHFHRDTMGSLVYAKSCKEKNENIIAMISMDILGCYSDEPGSQNYPYPYNKFYPDTGNFIAFVSDMSSRQVLYRAIETFRDTTDFPSEGGAGPVWIPGIGFSDHWSFWQAGYPAIMITDTGPNRSSAYHSFQDQPEIINFDKMTHVVKGIGHVVSDFAGYEGELWKDFNPVNNTIENGEE